MLTARTLTDGRLAEFDTVVSGAFYADVHEDQPKALALLDPARTHGIFDGTTLIGGGTMLARSMTLPGAGPVPIAAVSWVGIAADQRRRGALTTLMRAQLHGLHESGGDAVAVLWASEGGIYGRFGYGLASRRTTLTVPRGAELRSDVDAGSERVALLEPDAAAPAVRKVHAEYAATRIGGLSRPEPAWELTFYDPERWRGGATAMRCAVVSGGYALFRVKENWDGRHGPQHTVRVHELAALTPTAHAALWRFLTHLDLVGEVRYGNAPTDDPLPFMLDNPRHAATDLNDGMYVRLVDVDRALLARRYSAPLDIVIDLSDEFCPWNAGRWHLSVSDSGSGSGFGSGSGDVRVERTDADADLACSSTDLGAVYLGSSRLSALAAAGRVRELRPGAVRAATAAFAAEHGPHCLEVF